MGVIWDQLAFPWDDYRIPIGSFLRCVSGPYGAPLGVLLDCHRVIVGILFAYCRIPPVDLIGHLAGCIMGFLSDGYRMLVIVQWHSNRIPIGLLLDSFFGSYGINGGCSWGCLVVLLWFDS